MQKGKHDIKNMLLSFFSAQSQYVVLKMIMLLLLSIHIFLFLTCEACGFSLSLNI